MTQGLSFFETAVGTCGVVWGDQGLLAVALPSLGASDPGVKLARRFPDATEAPPPAASPTRQGVGQECP